MELASVRFFKTICYCTMQSRTNNNRNYNIFSIRNNGGRCVLLTEDEIKGKAKQAEGKEKEAEGKMQDEWGKMKKKVS
jgi:hypothetical protein